MKRRELFALPAALPLLAAVQPFGDSIVDPAGAKLTHESFGDLRIFFDGRTEQLQSMTAGSLRLNPGMSPHPPHEHPEEEFMVITEGTGEILVNGKTQKVGPGSMMYSGANRSHGITNTGTTPLLFYFYKWRK